jgi:hypothetical protein
VVGLLLAVGSLTCLVRLSSGKEQRYYMAKYYKAIADVNIEQYNRHNIPGFLTFDPMVALAYVQAGESERYGYIYEFDIDTSKLKNVGDKDLCFFHDRSIKPGYYSNLATDAYKHGGLGTIVINVPIKGKIVAAYKVDKWYSNHKQIGSPNFERDFENANKGEPTWHREDIDDPGEPNDFDMKLSEALFCGYLNHPASGSPSSLEYHNTSGSPLRK